MNHVVFVSHASKDRDVADALCEHLEATGIRCWIAPRDVERDDYARSIVSGIEASQVFLLLLSEHSNGSADIERELKIATETAGVSILPVRLDDQPPSPPIRYFLGAASWIDIARDEPETNGPVVETAVRRLVPDLPAAPTGAMDENRVREPIDPDGDDPPPPFRWRLWLAVSLVLAVIAYVLCVVTGPCRSNDVVVPDVIGKRFGDARRELMAAGLDVPFRPVEVPGPRPPASVIAQDPAPGTRVRRGVQVILTIQVRPRTPPGPDEPPHDTPPAGIELSKLPRIGERLTPTKRRRLKELGLEFRTETVYVPGLPKTEWGTILSIQYSSEPVNSRIAAGTTITFRIQQSER